MHLKKKEEQQQQEKEQDDEEEEEEEHGLEDQLLENGDIRGLSKYAILPKTHLCDNASISEGLANLDGIKVNDQLEVVSIL